MKPHLFLWVMLLFGTIACYSQDFLRLQDDTRISDRDALSPPRRTLKSEVGKGAETALVAALDGTIYLLEVGSLMPLWSFSSGSQIYSSYRAPFNDKENVFGLDSNYFIDCGDDWELYVHNSLGKLKLMKCLEEYITSTPQIGEDGGIVHGSKKTTTYLIDIKTGRVIRTYGNINDLPYNMSTKGHEHYDSGSEVEKNDLPLYITRTDYTLTSFSSDSDKVLWNLSVAEFGAAFLCRDLDDSTVVEVAFIGSSKSPYKMPLPCQSRALIYRFRSNNLLDSLSLPAGSPKAFYQDRMLPSSKADALPVQPNAEKVLELLTLPDSRGKDMDTKGIFRNEKYAETGSGSSNLILFIVLSLIVVSLYKLVSRVKLKWYSESTGISPTNIASKRKKSRKTSRNGSQEKENEVQADPNVTESNFWVLNQTLSSSEGRTIGKLFVSNKEIAKGSNGTIVLEGAYEGRLVAVKRLVRAYNDIAFKEIQNLIISDRHPNIVRWYGVEQDRDFVYLALERCACSLNELVVLKSSTYPTQVATENKNNITLDFMNGFMHKFELWDKDGYPLPLLFKLIRDVISGLAHLHELGIIHRDLKPQNVLITSENSLCAKISDMGISKRLLGETSSLTYHATGCGSSGWQAPEQLLQRRHTRAVDLFSLGSLLFFCITGGKHPFGNTLERDVNIAKNKVDLFLIQHIPEAVDIIWRLLDPSADLRPRALEVLNHPLFWNAEMRLSFLRDTSDRMELEDRGSNESDLLKSLQSIASVALGGAKWSDKMEAAFIDNIGCYRRYKFDSVRDLLRVMRNKLNHYRELPTDIQGIIGGVPEGFDRYFRTRFPNLLIEVYKVMISNCCVREEPFFSKYYLRI